MINREMLFSWVRLVVFLLMGAVFVQAGKEKGCLGKIQSFDAKKVYVVYASNLIYNGGVVLPGVDRLFQEQGYAVVAPGGSPMLRLTLQHYQAPEPTRYAYLNTLGGMDGAMVAAHGLEAYYFGEHVFDWIVAPVEDVDELDNFGFGRDRIIPYDPSRGETIEGAVWRFIVAQGGLRPSSRQSWDGFLHTLPVLLQEYAPLNYNNDRFLEIQTFEAALAALYAPIVAGLAGRRLPGALVPVGEAMTHETFDNALRFMTQFQTLIQTFATSLRARLWLIVWNVQMTFWRDWLDLYYSYIRIYGPIVARETFVNVVAAQGLSLVEALGLLLETRGLTDLQDEIFVRTDPSAGALGWGTLMDRPFQEDDAYYGEAIDLLEPEHASNHTQLEHASDQAGRSTDGARLLLSTGIGGRGVSQ